MLWTLGDLRGRVFKNLGQQDSDDNELLTVDDVNAALELAEQQWARETLCFRRAAVLRAVDGQAVYTLPEDMPHLVDLFWDTQALPLCEYDEFTLRRMLPSFRALDPASPTHWYRETPATVRLFPASKVSGSESITLYGHYIPLAIGGKITAVARANNTVTVTTAGPHRLRIGDSVTVSGCAMAGLNKAYTVAGMPSAVDFTAADAGAGESGENGFLSYTGGVLPMLADTDVPNLPLTYRLALVHYAVWWLAENQLATDLHAQSVKELSLALYQQATGKFAEDGLL